MSNIILVAYRLKPSGLTLPLAEPKAPSNYKDPQKIADYITAKQAEQQRTLAATPYAATFDYVTLVDLASAGKVSFSSKGRELGGEKPPVSVAVKSHLLNLHPHAWPEGFHQSADDQAAYLVGFNVKLFLKVLGTECSLPAYQPKDAEGVEDTSRDNSLPLSMWVGNRNHRDIESIVIPSDYKDVLSWPAVLEARDLRDKFEKWEAPHVDPETDLRLITELATQVGMFK